MRREREGGQWRSTWGYRGRCEVAKGRGVMPIVYNGVMEGRKLCREGEELEEGRMRVESSDVIECKECDGM